MNQKRDNFKPTIVDILKSRAAYICSNPECRKMTIAPSVEDETKAQYIGIIAHIAAAAERGPRYDATMTAAERMSITNGIFLCCNCATMIDKNDGIDYPKETLNQWKSDHEKWVLSNLNKSILVQSNEKFSSKSENQVGGITANIVNINALNINAVNSKRELDESKELDRILYKKLKEELLPANGSINFIRTNDFKGHFIGSYLDDFDKYMDFCTQPDFEFMDKDLDIILKSLTSNIRQFKWVVSVNTWRTDNPETRIYSVPKEWEYEKPTKYQAVIDKIHNAAEAICNDYDNLIKQCRKQLVV